MYQVNVYQAQVYADTEIHIIQTNRRIGSDKFALAAKESMLCGQCRVVYGIFMKYITCNSGMPITQVINNDKYQIFINTKTIPYSVFCIYI